MNKALALLRNMYDDDHDLKITVTEQNAISIQNIISL